MSKEYIEKIADYIVDIEKLISEYQSIKHSLIERKRPNTIVLAQKMLIVVNKNTEFYNISSIPYTREIVKDLQQKFNFSSATYRCLMPDTCYSWHTDIGKNCIHIPIITNEGCRFVYEDKVYYMPADGAVYHVSNDNPHSFMNAGKSPRVHITIENFE